MPTINYTDAYTIDRPISDDASEFVSNISPWRFTLDLREAVRFPSVETAQRVLEALEDSVFGNERTYGYGGWDYHYRVFQDRRINVHMSELTPTEIR